MFSYTVVYVSWSGAVCVCVCVNWELCMLSVCV